ncbi:MAG: hypothetical protein KatS3mg057_0685 [Herpetosiphonaceae bacterium]|nr:MAG: hypothetical protein KatS3mg057_0685 [Herpetosiphonaceae bacterium]
MEQAAVDYIAGMTDRYALTIFNQLYVPRTLESVGGEKLLAISS